MSHHYFDAYNGQVVYDNELEGRYEEYLDEIHGVISVCGIDYDAGRAFRQLDPVAFECGLNEWIDSLIDDGHLIDPSA